MLFLIYLYVLCHLCISHFFCLRLFRPIYPSREWRQKTGIMYFSALIAEFNAESAMNEYAHAVATNNPEQQCVYEQLFKPFRRRC